jgi:hypothetical protein
MGMRDQVSETQLQNQEASLLKQQNDATMISLLQGIAASQQQLAVTQQQTTLLLTRLLGQEDGGAEMAVGGVAGLAVPGAAPPARRTAQVIRRQQEDDVGEDYQGNNNNNNNQHQQQALLGGIPDPRAHEAVVPPAVMQRRVARTVENSLVEGGVSLVKISGCPASFKVLVQQWEVQRLGRYISSVSRRGFSTKQKNAWTKWSRLYNLVLKQAGFDQLQAGQSPFPNHMTGAESFRRMNASADYFDSQRGRDSTDKFYKQVVRDCQGAGLLENCVRNQGI